MSRNGTDVAVVGGGAVGASIALELARGGASVTLLERGPELAWGCSAGNAGIVGASHVVPLAEPAAVRDGLRWMTRPDSPFFVRPRPQVLPWLLRFVAAATPPRVRRHRAVLRALATHSAALHADLEQAGLDAGYRRAGLLNVYRDPRAYGRALRDGGQDGSLPGLSPGFAGAVLEPDEAHCDPLRFVEAVGALAAAEGVDIRTGVEVLGLRRSNGRVSSLWTTAGELVADRVVLAAGVWTGELARSVGVRLPLEGGKGYHVDLEAGPGDPELPVWLDESRVVITPLEGRLRLAGTLELTGTDRGVDARRVDAIVAAARRALPHLASRRTLEVWRGLRPCTPDGLPAIGRAPQVENAVLATGHGMWGLQLAPLTARLVAALVAGERPEHDLAPLRPDRFQRNAGSTTS
ncbi:MAG TPA: FAD-dependent oxidoreductase [Solirubrobacter sp.]|nr:FAD-dependent oxidoreductase [Solirubrobacter sp.]